MKRIIFTILIILLSGCAIPRSHKKLDNMYFNYDISKKDLTNIIQVFDDGRSTYIHVFELGNKHEPTVRVSNKGEYSKRRLYNIRNSYIIFGGIYDQINVNFNGKESEINRR